MSRWPVSTTPKEVALMKLLVGWSRVTFLGFLVLSLGLTLISRSEEHTSELQSLRHLVCRLLLAKKKNVAESPTHPRIDLARLRRQERSRPHRHPRARRTHRRCSATPACPRGTSRTG